ncbi:MAG: hypothetical protein AYP45_01040 [Candidatus Brocadia carolinensis]|uniref:Uncharacterized protein n=1 Tax=Candidatus Brocadia carolinensis TaxID=1004156 RepID=A0A1V4AXK8_9BACT|nr:MAG: hypothetical protein AYP45_01040 [Candidatus Brocadia caroliniensis]
MTTEVNEPIKVGAIFGDNNKKLKPVWFVWSGRKYNVLEITYIWTERMGKASIHHFTVTDGANLFAISYNTDTLVWTLRSVETDGYTQDAHTR